MQGDNSSGGGGGGLRDSRNFTNTGNVDGPNDDMVGRDGEGRSEDSQETGRNHISFQPSDNSRRQG